jgi:hypothetical protein
MKKLILVPALMALALVAVPAVASAAAISECGQNTEGYWSYAKESGAGVRNLTTRNVRCGYARGFVFRAHRAGGQAVGPGTSAPASRAASSMAAGSSQISAAPLAVAA